MKRSGPEKFTSVNGITASRATVCLTGRRLGVTGRLLESIKPLRPCSLVQGLVIPTGEFALDRVPLGCEPKAWSDAQQRRDCANDQTVILQLRQTGDGGDGNDSGARDADRNGTAVIGMIVG